MDIVKRIAVLLLTGAAAGNLFVTLIGPSFLVWYNTGSDANALCNCATVAKAATSQLIQSQLTGSAVGAVVFLVGGIALSRVIAARRKEKSPESSSPPTSTTPPQS